MASPDDRIFWTEFIELYRANPCLWMIHSRDYNDRKKKTDAYKILVEKLQEKDPSATRETVCKKINSLRCAFRKELKKVLLSEQTGMGEVYRSNLWYFDLLLFLKEEQALHNIKEDPEGMDHTVKVEVQPLISYMLEPKSENGQEPSQQQPPPPTTTTSPAPMTWLTHDSVRTPMTWVTHDGVRGGVEPLSEDNSNHSRMLLPNSIKRRKKISNTADPARILSLIGDRIAATRPEDEWDCLGKVVAAKLRKLPPTTQICAEKLIHEVLFQAQMGSLDERTTLCSDGGHHHKPSTSSSTSPPASPFPFIKTEVDAFSDER